jgi:pyruvate/2-oxoglutarate/acetoin dehydrogenase E1 component
MSRKSFAKTVAATLAEEMRRDERVILMGLDVGKYGNAFAATVGLIDEFGPERVLDMPISEEGYVGAAVGAAITGLRPVVELQFSDWITVAMDMICNQAANMRYMFGGSLSVPMVLRLPTGAYLQAAAQHSHSWESWFAFVPGLKVVIPSNGRDLKGLLKASIRDDNPVLFFEHKKLYDQRYDVPDDPDFTLPFGKADVKREGKDVSIITYSYMVQFALEAAEKLAAEGIDVEVVDLMTIKPIDREAIIRTAQKTGRILCLQEAWLTCSVASEMAAIIAEELSGKQLIKIRRLGSKDAPIPFSPKLEAYVLPSVEGVIEEACLLMRED